MVLTMEYKKKKTFKTEDENGNKKDPMPEIFNLLSKRDYSIKAFEQKLIQKGLFEEDAKRICVSLSEKGYLNDERYAARVTEIYYEKYGIRRVENELLKRGLEIELVKKITDEFYDRQKAVEHIYIEARKVLNSASTQKRLNTPGYERSKEYQRLFGKFFRTGYNSSEIKEALSMCEEFKEEKYNEEDDNLNDE